MAQDRAALLIVSRPDVKQEAGGMDFVAWVWLFGGWITAQDGAQFIDAQTGSDDPHPVIDYLRHFLAQVLNVDGFQHVYPLAFIKGGVGKSGVTSANDLFTGID